MSPARAVAYARTAAEREGRTEHAEALAEAVRILKAITHRKHSQKYKEKQK